jgi:hypothetical protein
MVQGSSGQHEPAELTWQPVPILDHFDGQRFFNPHAATGSYNTPDDILRHLPIESVSIVPACRDR